VHHADHRRAGGSEGSRGRAGRGSHPLQPGDQPHHARLHLRPRHRGAGHGDLDDREAARISVESIQQAVKRLAGEDSVDGVFVSCTSLRLTDVAREIEAEVGKPVTSSDHALAWHCLRLAGVDEAMPEFGRLYELALTT
jgi:hypothetical protein